MNGNEKRIDIVKELVIGRLSAHTKCGMSCSGQAYACAMFHVTLTLYAKAVI